MNRILLVLGLFLITVTELFSQVGIGTTDPKDSAQLDVVATDKGILIPRVSLVKTSQYTPITGVKVNSLLVYNTQTKTTTAGEEVYPGYYYWFEGKWNRVISKQDFNNKEIIKNILEGSNIVTYDPITKNLNYYTTTGSNTVSIFDVINTTSGTIKVDKIKAGNDWEVLTSKSGTTVWENILTIINNSSSTQQIDPIKIKPSDRINDVLTTVTKTTVGGAVVTVTSWKNINDLVDVDGKDIHGSEGIKFLDGASTKTTIDKAVLKTFTITVSDLPVSKLQKGKDGQILVTDMSGNVTWTSSLPASTTVSVTNIVGVGTTTGVVVIDKSGHATVTTINNMLSGTNVVIYDTKSKTFNYYTNSGTSTTTSVNVVDIINNTATSSTISSTRITAGKDWEVLTSKSNTTVWEDIVTVLNNSTSTTKIDASKIDGKDLITPANSGVSIVNGTGAVLKTTTITIENLPVDKLKAETSDKDKVLQVNSSGTPVWTTLPTGTPTGKDIHSTEGVKFVTSTGSGTTVTGAVLETFTVTVSDLPVNKLKKGDKGTILVTDMSGNVTWTSSLPASTTVSVTNIVGVGTTTGVIVIDKSGHATVTTINNMLSGTNVVIYDTKSKTFNYYTNSGTSTTTNVNVVDIINNTASSSTISATRIDAQDLALGDGLEFSTGTNSKTQALVLSSASITVKDLPANKLKPSTVSGTILVTDMSGNVTWTSSLPASTTVSVTNIVGVGTTTGVVVIDKSGHATVTTVNNMLSGTNVVIYDTKSKTFNYYTNSGTSTTTSVNVVDIINNTATSSTISSTRITAGNDWEVLTSKSNTTVWEDIATILNNSTSTTKIDAGKIASKDLTSPVDSGVVIDNGIGAVLTTTTITIRNLPVSKLKPSIVSGRILVTDMSGNVTWTSSLPASTTVSVTNIVGVGTTTGVVVIDKSGHATVTTINNMLSGTNVVIYDTKSKTFNYYTNSGTSTTTNVNIVDIINNTVSSSTISPTRIDAQDLTLGDGLEFSTGTNSKTQGLVLSSTTITVKDLPVDKLKPSTVSGTILVTDMSGNVTWTSSLPVSTTVSVTNIVSTKTGVVIITASGTGTVTTLELAANYVIKPSYDSAEDETTGSNLIDKTGGGTTDVKFVEKMRTVEVYVAKTSTTSITTELLVLDENKLNSGDIMISEVKIFSKGKVFTDRSLDPKKKRFVTFLAATYEVIEEDNSGGGGSGSKVKKGVVRPGISSGGFTTSIYRGSYYISIKYLEKQP